MSRATGILSIGLLCALGSAAPITTAMAASFTQAGSSASLDGQIAAGDDQRLSAFLHRPEASSIRVIYLNSPGGYVYEAYKMSEMIRSAHLATAVDGSRALCASACTALFTAGVQRYYFNTQSITDGGFKERRGLGFHGASSWGGGRYGSERTGSSAGSNELSYIYREMGVPAASSLAERASYTSLYCVSGQTALSLGVATNLNKP